MKNKSYSHDNEVPLEIKAIQEWFASIIIRPLVDGDRINPIAPNGISISQEATKYVISTPELMPHQRLEIYNRQYWWRLINFLQMNYPLTLRLLGYESFKKIIIQYLIKHPPDHWSMTTIGGKFPKWLRENHGSPDMELIYHAAEIDCLFYTSFISDQYSYLSMDYLEKYDTNSLVISKFYLQPHLYLVEYPYDLPSFREIVLQNKPEYWIKNPFPSLHKNISHYFAIFRNQKNNIAWKGISKEEFITIQQFKEGSSLLKISDWIKDQELGVQLAMVENLQRWVKEWTLLGWLALPKVKS